MEVIKHINSVVLISTPTELHTDSDGPYCTFSPHSGSKHFDLGGVDSRIHHHLSRETRDGLASILQLQSVHARGEGDVGHRVRPVFVVHHLGLGFGTWNKRYSFSIFI